MSVTASLLLLLDPLGVRISFLCKSTLYRRHCRQGEGKALRGGNQRFNDVIRVSQRQDRGASRVPPSQFHRLPSTRRAKFEECALAEAVSVTHHRGLTKSDPVVLLKLPASLCSGFTRSRGDGPNANVAAAPTSTTTTAITASSIDGPDHSAPCPTLGRRHVCGYWTARKRPQAADAPPAPSASTMPNTTASSGTGSVAAMSSYVSQIVPRSLSTSV